MYLDPLSPEEKMMKYRDFNTEPSTIANAGVTYIPNPNITPTVPDVHFTDLFAGKSSYLPSPNTATITPTSKEDPLKDPTPTKVGSTPTPPSNASKPMSDTAPIPAKATVNNNAKTAYDYLVKSHNLPPHIAAGIVGNLYQESGVDPTRKQNDGGPGRGIAQWGVNDRWKGLQTWASANKKDPNDLHTQLDYILIEPGQESAIKRTMATKDPIDAAMTFGKYFEAPNEKAANWDHRVSVANTLYNSK